MNNMRYLFTTLCLVLLSGLAGINGSAIASTPDGETPANEGVCDPLKADGITKGLYGLCVAYCEAQDLDTVDKEPPSTKILENYNKKKAAGDPAMPCIQIACPCWSDAELAATTADGMVSACVSSGETIQLIDNVPSGKVRFARSDQTGRCSFLDTTGIPPIVRNLNITQPEAQSCHAQLASACTSVGQ